MPLTNTARRVELLEETQFKKLEEQEFITVLGYSIKNNSSSKKNLWHEIINKLKLSLEKLAYRNLLLKGRILLANSLILSKIWYIAYLLPPSKKQIADINRLVTL